MRTIATLCSFILVLSASASMQPSWQRSRSGRAPAASNDKIATLLTAGDIRGHLIKMTEDRPEQEHTVVERVGVWRLSVEHRKQHRSDPPSRSDRKMLIRPLQEAD